MKNYFGEEISNEEVIELAEEIQELDLERIDLFFYYCGWVEKDREGNNSVAMWKLKSFKEKKGFAIQALKSILSNIPMSELMAALTKAKKI